MRYVLKVELYGSLEPCRVTLTVGKNNMHSRMSILGLSLVDLKDVEHVTDCFGVCMAVETVINLQDEEGFTPLMWAAAHGQIAVVEFLLQNVSTMTC